MCHLIGIGVPYFIPLGSKDRIMGKLLTKSANEYQFEGNLETVIEMDILPFTYRFLGFLFPSLLMSSGYLKWIFTRSFHRSKIAMVIQPLTERIQTQN